MKTEYFKYMPPAFVLSLKACLAVGIILIFGGLITTLTDIKNHNMITTLYAYGMALIGMFLVFLGGSVFLLNIQRREQNQSSFSPTRAGSSEGGSFAFNQVINLSYIGLGVFISFLALFMLRL